MPIVQDIKYSLLSVCCFCLVGYTVSLDPNAKVNKLLSSRFFSFSGKISYGLYIYHPLVFELVISTFPSTTPILLTMVVCLLISYLVAYISFTFFESKFIAMKKYFEYDRPMARPAVQ